MGFCSLGLTADSTVTESLCLALPSPACCGVPANHPAPGAEGAQHHPALPDPAHPARRFPTQAACTLEIIKPSNSSPIAPIKETTPAFREFMTLGAVATGIHVCALFKESFKGDPGLPPSRENPFALFTRL